MGSIFGKKITRPTITAYNAASKAAPAAAFLARRARGWYSSVKRSTTLSREVFSISIVITRKIAESKKKPFKPVKLAVQSQEHHHRRSCHVKTHIALTAPGISQTVKRKTKAFPEIFTFPHVVHQASLPPYAAISLPQTAFPALPFGFYGHTPANAVSHE